MKQHRTSRIATPPGGFNHSGVAALVLATGLLAMVATGCRAPLLSPNDERTPYDRYDTVRAQSAPQYITDEYGRRRPNLRERLLPKD